MPLTQVWTDSQLILFFQNDFVVYLSFQWKKLLKIQFLSHLKSKKFPNHFH
jgi:hypothetical protein